VDDEDLPLDDGDDCTAQVCDDGTASYPLEAENAPCAQDGGKVCTTAGQCVECNVVSHCTDPTSPCQTVRCEVHGCIVDNTASGTPLPASYQSDQDCAIVVCDGNGGYTEVTDSSDVLPDGNDCTLDQCLGTTPAYAPLLPGEACSQSGGQVCDGYGTCVECVSDAQCAPPNTCDGGGVDHECGCTVVDPCVDHICGTWSNGCGVDVDCNGELDDDQGETAVDCGGTNCPPCGLGLACMVDSDCDSGYCVRPSVGEDPGVCCNARCDQSCFSCLEAHTNQPDGSCLPVAADGANPAGNSDPWDDCDEDTPQSCEQNGDCDGFGGCAVWHTNTECLPAGCGGTGGDYRRPASTCDGAGSCDVAPLYSCGNYTCNGGVCYTWCMKIDQCATNYTCSNPNCVP